MRAGLAAFLGCGALAATLPGERDLAGYTFEHYKEEFGKGYLLGSTQHSDREAVFNANLAAIRRHNADTSKTWFMTVNEFADLTNEEFRARRTGYKGYPEGALQASEPIAIQDLPDSMDWRSKDGVVTKAKNQGGCGSCWAFSAAETLESHLAIATGKPAPLLSPQQIVSCAPNPQKCGGTGGCAGSTQPLAFNYTATVGLTTEANYAYRGVTGTCEQDKIKPVAKNTGFVSLPVNDYSALVGAVAGKGPIAISVAAGGLGWQFYGGGVYGGGLFGCGYTVDHAVQLVGYGKDADTMYWAVRNSWGEGWGEKGYIRLKRFGEGQEPCGTDKRPGDGNACAGNTTKPTVCGLCAILSSSSYPTGVAPAEDVDIRVV